MLIIGMLAVRLFYSAPKEQIGILVKERQTNNSPQQLEQHTQAFMTNVQGSANTNWEVGGFFKTITDPQSGQYAIVNSNKAIVTWRDKNGKVIWSADIVGSMPRDIKTLGDAVTGMEFTNNELLVWVGFSGFSLDKQTGKITYLGTD